ncbi:hypothetical protein D9M72_471020 [compost metagenome]
MAGALANGLDCIGVSWGFAPDGELHEAGAMAIVHTTTDLLAVVESLDAVRAAALSGVNNDGVV